MAAQFFYLFCLSTALLAVIACHSNSAITLPSKGYYKIETFGQLPSLPDGKPASNAVSLVQANGDSPQYLTNAPTKIRAGKDMECEVKADSMVEAIADAGNLLLVQVSRCLLTASCANSGLADFVEGYVEKSSLELKTTASSDGTLTSGDNTSEVPEERPPTDLPVCESARYAAYVEENISPQEKSSRKSLADFRKIAVTSAKTSTGRMPGNLWRQGGGQFVLLVKGKATSWKAQAINKTALQASKSAAEDLKNNAAMNTTTQMDEKILNSADLKVASSGEFEIPFTSFVKNPNDWRGATLEIVVKAAGSEAIESEQPCTVEIRLQSPLVLDFSARPMIETIPLAGLSARFDLNADGIAEKTGWIDGRQAAFLALDLNANGKIDSGRELFGDSTLLADSKISAQQGFAALAQYDSNSDGKID